MLKTILICTIAGLGAGLSTGFAGLSAAVFISPMLVAFLDVPVFEAVGTALASDVIASLASAVTYARHKNIAVKKSRLLFAAVLVFAVIGSLIAYLITKSETGDTLLGYWSIISALLLGALFVFQGEKKKQDKAVPEKFRKLLTLPAGIYIGFVCGFQGTGGGMMLLFTLTLIMGFEFHAAVGTSVFIMTFTALIGALSHFTMNGVPEASVLIPCVISTTVFAEIGALLANHMEQRTLKKITGISLVISGAVMLWAKIAGV